MESITNKEIEEILTTANLSGYTGIHTLLGGGELNDTFKLEMKDGPIILRIAKYAEENKLWREARALTLIKHPQVADLIFYDKEQTIFGRQFILQSYVPGKPVERLSVAHYESLGTLLAHVHQASSRSDILNVWQKLLMNTHSFGDEAFFLNHPNASLRNIVNRMKLYCEKWQPRFASTPVVLIHSDATPSNVLIQNDVVYLIDWELSSYSDALAEFSTVFYEDMEFNKGKWRSHITPEEKSTLFKAYEAAGGEIDHDRVTFWMNHDKLGAALFLYWRINQSGRAASTEQMAQYQLDLDNLIASLDRNLP